MSFALLTRRLIVLALMLVTAIVYLFIGFNGLTTPKGMEKAQLAREVARGSYKTKMIRPVSIGQFQISKNRAPFFRELSKADTFNAPLYPIALGIVFKAIDAGDFEKWRMGAKDGVYQLDRVVAGLSMVFFILACFVAYLLARRIFDPTIAGITFFLLVMTDLFWQFTLTGMANSLMMLLFACAMYCIYVATEKTLEDGENGFLFGSLGGIFLILLSLTHWMALWILLGYLIYAFFFIRPMGAVAVVTILLSCLSFAHPVFQNYQQSGNPFGTAFYTLYAGLGLQEELLMRSGSPSDFYVPIKQIALVFISNFFNSYKQFFEYSGYIFAAPVFFLSCLHSFKKPAANNFRWGVLIIWAFASIGMSIYGIGKDALYSKQLHYLFAPVMATFGMAMIAVIWGRMKLPSGHKAWKEGYVWIMAIISATPTLFNLPQTALQAMRVTKRASSTTSINRVLNQAIPANQYIFSDQPWAIAWYADRYAIWTPRDYSTVKAIENLALKQNNLIAGIDVTSIEGIEPSVSKSGDLSSLAIDPWVSIITKNKIGYKSVSGSTVQGAEILRTYSNAVPYNGVLMSYYSRDPVDLTSLNENQ